MHGANFVSFFTVQGFFIGIVFSLLKADSAGGILTYTFLVTGFFYLFSHLCIALYLRTFSGKMEYFPKKAHERELDLFVREINKREELIEKSIKLNAQIMAKETL